MLFLRGDDRVASENRIGVGPDVAGRTEDVMRMEGERSGSAERLAADEP
jgi:hypothetical protein